MSNDEVHYGGGEDGEYYFKRNGHWYRKSPFFVEPIKIKEMAVPIEYVKAENRRSKGISSTLKTAPSPSQVKNGRQSALISFNSREHCSILKSNWRSDKAISDVYDNLIPRMESRKDIPKTDNKAKKSKQSIKAAISTFNERFKGRGAVFAVANKANKICENSAETQELAYRKNLNRVVKGEVVVGSQNDTFPLLEDGVFKIENFLQFAESKNVVVINAYEFLLANEEREAYFDDVGCVYCIEHGTLSAHTREEECPHLACTCSKCFALDLAKP